MQISKQNLLPIIANFGIGFFFLSVLSLKGGHNISPILLMLLGLGYSIYGLCKKFKWNLNKEDKLLIYSYLFYFVLFVISLLLNTGKAKELDNPSRVILLIPVLLLLLNTPIKTKILRFCIPLGSVIAGIVALYDKFILHSEMAFSPRTMHIQGGDIAMSLGIFSLIIAFYFWQKSQLKFTALCAVASLFGVAGSILSTARGGWLALPVALIVLCWCYRKCISKKFFISIISLFVIAIIGISQMPNNKISERLNAAQGDIQQYWEHNNGSTSVGARFDMWKSVFIMAKEKPILGWGARGALEKRQQLAQEGVISQYAGQFEHAHNQYLDDLSKRGILGLLAFLAILFVPLRSFYRGLKNTSCEVKLIASLGFIHIVSVMIYCLSQGFFTHNSGNIFYFFLTTVFYAWLKQAEKTPHLEPQS